MNNFKKYLWYFLMSSLWSFANAYVINKSKLGSQVHWPLSVSSQVEIFVNPQNNQSIPENTVQTIVQSAIDQWNEKSKIILHRNPSAGKNQDGLNELFFSTDPNIFSGTRVLGVTHVTSADNNGEILEADVIINDDVIFSATTTETMYIGNVITHEMGHFLGLGHGEVVGSTMFYTVTKGQSSVDPDDAAGIFANYPLASMNKGSIVGTVVGGSQSIVPVFGAHVQAISVKSGKILGAAVSELNGRFRIDGLTTDDQYLIYTSPSNPVGLPSSFANVRKDFCETSTSYRGSFFQGCGASNEGFPQHLAFAQNSKTIDVGNITIRCSLDTPPEYLQKKRQTPNTFDLNASTQQGIGGSFVGFFSNSEMQNHLMKDYFSLDLRSHDWSGTTGDLFLAVKVLNQSFNSAFKANVAAKYAGTTTSVTPKYQQLADGWISIESVGYFPISRSVLSDNLFEISVAPESMEYPSFPSGIPFSKTDLFPDFYEFQDELYFYLVIATIVKSNGDGTYSQIYSKRDVQSDNSTCLDGINTYALNQYAATGSNTDTSERKKIVSCATVDMNDRSGGGGGFFIGLFLCFLISYALTRYSKMA